MARKKKTIISGITRDEMEEAMHSYAVADAKQRALTAEMDGKLSAIREKYAQQLADLDTEKDEAFEKLQAFACREPRRTLQQAQKSGNYSRHLGLPHRQPAAETR